MEKDEETSDDIADYSGSIRKVFCMNSKEIVGSVFAVAFKIIIAIIVVMLVYKYAAMAYDYGYRVFGEGPVAEGEGREVTVTIGDGKSVKEIGAILENNGLIRDKKIFVIQEKLSEHKGNIQPGVYTLNTAMTAEEMIAVMTGTETTEEEESLSPLAQQSDETQEATTAETEVEAEPEAE